MSNRKKRKDGTAKTDADEPEEPIEEGPAAAEFKEEAKDPRDIEIAELKRQLAERAELAQAYFAQLQRGQADFENYQKRIEAERARIADNACATVITGLLDTIDNFERALAHLENVSEEDARGIAMVYESMLNYLRENGLERIAAQGCQFDPRRHDAILQVESADAADGTVLEEFQAGYVVKGKVVRPTKVKVSRAVEKKPCEEAGQTEVEIDGTSKDVERKEE